MNLEIIALDRIKVGDRRRKDLGDLSDLKESIVLKGIIQPITIDQDTNLLAGHRRLEACRQLETGTIPCIRRSVTGEIDFREIELFENIYRKDFTWLERCLAEEALFRLKCEADPNWSRRQQATATGAVHTSVNKRIELAQAVEAFPGLSAARTEDDAWKAYKKLEEKIYIEGLVASAKSKALKGVKIADKNYKIGDVLEGMDNLKEDFYQFAEVDPPYGVDLDLGTRKDQSQLATYTELPGDKYVQFISDLAELTFRCMREDTFVVWWFGMSWYTDTLATLRDAGFGVHDIPAIWSKGGPGQTSSPDTMLGSAYEPFFVCRKGQPKLTKAGRSNVFDYKPVPPGQKIHSTEKPLDLLVDILETFSYPGIRCVVPLLGSGVTLRACFATGRIGFGWDLSVEHKQAFLAKVIEDEEAGRYKT